MLTKNGWNAESAVLQYVTRLAKSPLEAQAALDDLRRVWNASKAQLVGLHILRDTSPNDEEGARLCIEIAFALRQQVRLGPNELRKLAQAHATLHQWNELAQLAREAGKQFAGDDVLRAAYALALDNLGRTDEAIKILDTIRSSERFPVEVYANIAARCGLQEQAIRLMETLLERETDKARKLVLLRSIFSLEFERDPQSPRILELAWAIGQVVDQSNEEEEGSFLVAFTTATLHEGAKPEKDQLSQWENRCRAFGERYPQSKFFRMVPTPKSGEDFEELLRREGLTDNRPRELLELEQRLRRGSAIPYCWRPRALLLNVADVGHLWALTKATRDTPEYELLISMDDADSLDGKVTIDGTPLIDLTALLVLSDLGLLPHVFAAFHKIAVTKLTVLQLRNLAHPLFGRLWGGAATNIIALLRQNLSKVDQPGKSDAGRRLADLNRKREEDQLDILRTEKGRYTFFCDDAVYLKFLAVQGDQLQTASTLRFLVFADRAGIVTPQMVASCIATLCTWNIGRIIIPARYFVAAIPSEAAAAQSRERTEQLLEAAPIRKIYDAVWAFKKPYLDVVRHIGWLLGYMVSSNPQVETVTASLLYAWYVKAKLRNEKLSPPLRHLAYAVLSAMRFQHLGPDAIHRLWGVYLKVVEWDAGDRMSVPVEDGAIQLLAEVACLSGARGVSADERLKLSMKMFETLQAGLTPGTHQHDVFRHAYEHAQAKLQKGD
jgi:hypothetical protein